MSSEKRYSERLKNFPELDAVRLASEEDRLLVAHCLACGEAHWYPRPICPLCHKPEIEFRTAVGHGTVYSFSILRRKEGPYVVAYVALAEGPMMLTNIVNCPPDDITIGMPVRLKFQMGPVGEIVPAFEPNPANA